MCHITEETLHHQYAKKGPHYTRCCSVSWHIWESQHFSRVLRLLWPCVAQTSCSRFMFLSPQSLLITAISLFHCRYLIPVSWTQPQRLNMCVFIDPCHTYPSTVTALYRLVCKLWIRDIMRVNKRQICDAMDTDCNITIRRETSCWQFKAMQSTTTSEPQTNRFSFSKYTGSSGREMNNYVIRCSLLVGDPVTMPAVT